MKHGFIYSILIAGSVLLGALPFAPYDIARLHPVKTVRAESREGAVSLLTDTGDTGSGTSWQTALEDLHRTTPGTILPGTVTFIILQDADILEDVLADAVLSPNCVVCLGENIEDLEMAGAFLSAHKPETSLVSLRAEKRPLPVLRQEEGGFRLSDGES